MGSPTGLGLGAEPGPGLPGGVGAAAPAGHTVGQELLGDRGGREELPGASRSGPRRNAVEAGGRGAGGGLRVRRVLGDSSPVPSPVACSGGAPCPSPDSGCPPASWAPGRRVACTLRN